MIDVQSVVFTGMAALVCLVLGIVSVTKRGRAHACRIFLLYGFIAYACGVLSVTLLPIQTHMPERDVVINLIPFNTIGGYFTDYVGAESLGFQLFSWNILGNVAIFLPFGFFIGMLFRRCQSVVYALIACVTFSVFIEVMQAVEMIAQIAFSRITDIDDVILNTLGGIIGYVVYAIFLKKRNLKNFQKMDDICE